MPERCTVKDLSLSVILAYSRVGGDLGGKDPDIKVTELPVGDF